MVWGHRAGNSGIPRALSKRRGGGKKESKRKGGGLGWVCLLALVPSPVGRDIVRKAIAEPEF